MRRRVSILIALLALTVAAASLALVPESLKNGASPTMIGGSATTTYQPSSGPAPAPSPYWPWH
jgi:hypothetical protein